MEQVLHLLMHSKQRVQQQRLLHVVQQQQQFCGKKKHGHLFVQKRCCSCSSSSVFPLFLLHLTDRDPVLRHEKRSASEAAAGDRRSGSTRVGKDVKGVQERDRKEMAQSLAQERGERETVTVVPLFMMRQSLGK